MDADSSASTISMETMKTEPQYVPAEYNTTYHHDFMHILNRFVQNLDRTAYKQMCVVMLSTMDVTQ